MLVEKVTRRQSLLCLHILVHAGVSLMMRDVSVMVCADDKHRVKVGELLCPVAAAEHGCQAIVHSRSAFQVGDHNFTKFSIIPSVVFEVNIPESIAGSWYDENVTWITKILPLNPLRPLCQLYMLLSLCQFSAAKA